MLLVNSLKSVQFNFMQFKRITVSGFLCLSAVWFSSATLHAACTAPPSGLVGWWTLDGTPNDIGGTNTSAAGGGLTPVDGYVGGAISFDGSSGFVATLLDVQPSAM